MENDDPLEGMGGDGGMGNSTVSKESEMSKWIFRQWIMPSKAFLLCFSPFGRILITCNFVAAKHSQKMGQDGGQGGRTGKATKGSPF